MRVELKLERSTAVSHGILENNGIYWGPIRVGRVDLVKFEIVNTPHDWEFLHMIIIRSNFRHKGFASSAVLKINEKLKNENKNGILINQMSVVEARGLYQHRGWTKIEDSLDREEIFINVPASEQAINEVRNVWYENLPNWFCSNSKY